MLRHDSLDARRRGHFSSGVRLVFREELQDRTQEFVLRWSADGGHMYREIVREQYTFRPPGTVREIEEYAVDLGG